MFPFLGGKSLVCIIGKLKLETKNIVHAHIYPKVGIFLRVFKLPQADLLLWPKVCGTRISLTL